MGHEAREPLLQHVQLFLPAWHQFFRRQASSCSPPWQVVSFTVAQTLARQAARDNASIREGTRPHKACEPAWVERFVAVTVDVVASVEIR